MLKHLAKLMTAYPYRRARKHCAPIKPVFVNYLCTFRCNSRCTMCNIWSLYQSREGKKQRSEELTATELRKILQQNQDFLSQVRHIGVTGGDPLLRPDIVELIQTLREKLPYAEAGIQTNGLAPRLVEQRVREILKFYPEFSLAVSLDGIGDVHDRIRGIPGAFERAMESIRIAQSLGVKRITTGMTLSNANANQIGEVKKLADELGTEFSCFLAEKSRYFRNEGDHEPLTEESRNRLIDDLKHHTAYHYFMDRMRRRLELGEKRRLPCYSGHTSLVWDPYGNVRICILRPEIFGNLRERSLQEMLTDAPGRRLRETVKRCDCWCQCEVSSSAVVDPWDVVSWWLFDCRQKNKFLQHLSEKAS